MAIIIRNDYGAVAVNKSVMERMMIGDLLEMSDDIILCNKKGKPIKEKPTPFIDPDYFDALDYSEKRGETRVKIYMIVRNGRNISEIADDVFGMVERDFALLRLEKPGQIIVKVKGISDLLAKGILKRNIEIVRNNV